MARSSRVVEAFGRPAGVEATLGLTLVRLGGLGALLWAVWQETAPGGSGKHLAVLVLTVVSSVAWLAWMAARHRAAVVPTALALVVLALAGGGLAALAPVAITFVAIAALGAGIALETRWAVGVTLLGAVSLGVAAAGAHQTAGFVISGIAAAATGFSAGVTRRQYVSRAHQAEELLEERVRADAERDRAAALAERNRIAREIHDLLAHSLGALAVQLDAADALLEDKGDAERAHEMIVEARGLAVQGLRETRDAVQALREDPVELAEQLQALAAHEGASFAVTGTARPLSAPAGHALYRAAQEALTNVRKHAPGSSVSVALGFDGSEATVTVVNGQPGAGTVPGDLGESGGGYGLRGMTERVELLGGRVSAGPSGGGYAVSVAVPA